MRIKEGYKKTFFWIPEETHRKIKTVAAIDGVTMTAIIDRWLHIGYIQEEAKKKSK